MLDIFQNAALGHVAFQNLADFKEQGAAGVLESQFFAADAERLAGESGTKHVEALRYGILNLFGGYISEAGSSP